MRIILSSSFYRTIIEQRRLLTPHVYYVLFSAEHDTDANASVKLSSASIIEADLFLCYSSTLLSIDFECYSLKEILTVCGLHLGEFSLWKDWINSYQMPGLVPEER